ncbi:unnamed protein product [Amoebophrya sp. A25]|nr:unnamed protein product [Amoebophrya sp. A25]|eukprot:GSA25T00017174001.1
MMGPIAHNVGAQLGLLKDLKGVHTAVREFLLNTKRDAEKNAASSPNLAQQYFFFLYSVTQHILEVCVTAEEGRLTSGGGRGCNYKSSYQEVEEFLSEVSKTWGVGPMHPTMQTAMAVQLVEQILLQAEQGSDELDVDLVVATLTPLLRFLAPSYRIQLAHHLHTKLTLLTGANAVIKLTDLHAKLINYAPGKARAAVSRAARESRVGAAAGEQRLQLNATDELADFFDEEEPKKRHWFEEEDVAVLPGSKKVKRTANDDESSRSNRAGNKSKSASSSDSHKPQARMEDVMDDEDEQIAGQEDDLLAD